MSTVGGGALHYMHFFRMTFLKVLMKRGTLLGQLRPACRIKGEQITIIACVSLLCSVKSLAHCIATIRREAVLPVPSALNWDIPCNVIDIRHDFVLCDTFREMKKPTFDMKRLLQVL